MIEIAYRFLRHDLAKSLAALFGVVVAAFLIGQQTGLFGYIVGTMSALVDNADADLWVIDRRTNDVNHLPMLDARVRYEVASLPGVRSAHAIVHANAPSRFPNGSTRGLKLIGAEPPLFTGGPWNVVAGHVNDLLQPNTVGIDVYDRANLSDIGMGDAFEARGQRVVVGMMTKGARGFSGMHVYVTLDMARRLGGISSDRISGVLVRAQLGVASDALAERIEAALPEVRAWTPAALSQSTRRTMLSSLGVGVALTAMMIFALVSGLCIVGLTIYSAAVDRIRDYGMMKAIGATNGTITRLVLLQASLFGLAGWLIGMVLVEAFRRGLETRGIVFSLGWDVVGSILAATMIICLGGATFAVHRLRKVEPAEAFR